LQKKYDNLIAEYEKLVSYDEKSVNLKERRLLFIDLNQSNKEKFACEKQEKIEIAEDKKLWDLYVTN
jgi:hypothetical protein